MIQEKISSMTTEQFCKEQLCKKLHISCLSDTQPAFLMKVGETISESTIYANFLRIVIGDNVLDEIKQFMYRFTSMMNSEYSILRNIYNSNDRFIYSGVYKQIMDLCLMKENAMSIVLLDTMQQKIRFPEINEELLKIGFGTTLFRARGGYMREDKEVICCAASNRTFHQVKRAALSIDEKAFITVTEMNEVSGNGFTMMLADEEYVPVLSERHDGHTLSESL
jgi:uncharacterized membrane-anchored protein YitT (DUF2179 family)